MVLFILKAKFICLIFKFLERVWFTYSSSLMPTLDIKLETMATKFCINYWYPDDAVVTASFVLPGLVFPLRKV